MSVSSRRVRHLCLDSLEWRNNPASSFVALGAAAGGLPLAQLARPDGTVLAQVQPFDAGFAGGVRASVGELDGDPNTVELVTAAGPGGGPHVKVYRVDIATGRTMQIANFFAFEAAFTGGVRVAVGNIGGGDGRQEVIVGADAGGGPRVRAFDLDGAGNAVPIAGPLGDFFAYEPTFTGGVRVAAGELDGNVGDGDELLVAAGPGGGPRIQVYRSDGAELSDFFAFRPDFLGGVNVAVDSSGGSLATPRVDALAADFSERSTALNTAAGVGQTPALPTTPVAGTGSTLGAGGAVTGTAVGTTTVSASATPAVQLSGGISGFGASAAAGPSSTGAASTGLGTGIGTASTGIGAGLGAASTGAGSGGLASIGASAGNFTTGSFGATSSGTPVVTTGGINTTTASGVNGTTVVSPGLSTTAPIIDPSGLAFGPAGVPVAFTGAAGTPVFADNPGDPTAFPSLLAPAFAEGFVPTGGV
ncbi:hypothetical protein [Limnoglobus roseus]|uniref:YD repeat protein n=1 Tax=Limnoglobus roseus TaxID=2598579 RepID=A0A5C1ARK8_9BACT|nr:hypothetical protein [Limnoglobus roseus]QEL20646.1 YD repeat protein [Limnoglobus roseus]